MVNGIKFYMILEKSVGYISGSRKFRRRDEGGEGVLISSLPYLTGGGGLSESPATNNWNPLDPITSRVESKLVTLM